MITLLQACTDYINKKSQSYKNKKIIDLGCGTGHFTTFFGQHNKVIGVDIQNVVNNIYKNFTFRITDATKLPFEDNIFDLVISFDVIEHIENDDQMITEAYRILKKGGKIFFGTPNRERLANVVLKVIGKQIKYPLSLGNDKLLGEMIHIREYTKDEIEKILKRHNFRQIKVTHFWFGTPFLKYGTIKLFDWSKKYCQYLFFEAIKIL